MAWYRPEPVEAWTKVADKAMGLAESLRSARRFVNACFRAILLSGHLILSFLQRQLNLKGLVWPILFAELLKLNRCIDPYMPPCPKSPHKTQ